MSRRERIRERIERKLAPLSIDIEDETALHLTHEAMLDSAMPSETHLKIYVVSEKFNGMSYLARNRLVNDLISGEFAKGLHAVTITCDSEEEYRSEKARK